MSDTTTSARLMRTVTYVSTATRDIGEADLRELFVRAAEFNDSVGVTGLLLFYQGVFLQTVEGSPDDVEKVFERIKRDPLHHIDSVFVDESIDRRVYLDWAMMASCLVTPDAMLVSFLRDRKESPDMAFTAGQRSAVNRTLQFALRGFSEAPA